MVNFLCHLWICVVLGFVSFVDLCRSWTCVVRGFVSFVDLSFMDLCRELVAHGLVSWTRVGTFVVDLCGDLCCGPVLWTCGRVLWISTVMDR